MNKRVMFSVILILAVVLAGCGVKQEQKEMYNSNQAIAGSGDSYSYGNRSGEVTAESADIEFTKFYGSDTIWTIEAEQDSKVNIEYQQSMKDGEFKIVLITPDGNVQVVAENRAEGETELILPKGKNVVKFVGRGGDGKVHAGLTSSGDLPVTVVNAGGMEE